jgi:hypothetical protein
MSVNNREIRGGYQAFAAGLSAPDLGPRQRRVPGFPGILGLGSRLIGQSSSKPWGEYSAIGP